MAHPDQKYIDALLNNDTAVIRELYRNYSAKIKWMVLKNNGTEDEVGDLIQESLMAIYRRALKGDFVLTCPFDAYFYMVCKKKWLNVLAKRKTDKTVTIEDDNRYNLEDDSFRLAEESLVEEGRRNLLLQKIQELGTACRELLELSWSEKSMEEVASLLNYSYGYARKKKSECMAKLIQAVKQSPAYQKLKW
ncbi:RNA polymerase, sigma-24 subunit, ECF subfamily [Lunatimonas lonarensis]|uniref:RNA polymerase, sigma-24 subunit, ECF subfamily n=1 Tax=Lunatimonas lonarensis TaxID=1232681 RepID=R7ZPF0_9BACT|nr:sigma-70 family RNA polymerase sigma factor [Lunatimonas lonarensis]EON75975.1 RNA polymerase, sigma-24 subunit, ECF subfamily [Lunatimonas lonarensis]